MKFVEVKEIPKRYEYRRNNEKNLKHILEEFMSMNVKFAKLEFDSSEYISARCAYDAFHPAIKRFGVPVSIHERHGEIYFERRDI